MEIKRIDSESELWFSEWLYLHSFPENERRDVEDWIRLTHNEPAFHNNIILEDSKNVGLITFWNFADFVYVEHFAIDNSIRGKGLGGLAIEMLLKKVEKPVVLEVEPPVGDIEKRRIAFYERHGFILCDKKYFQPAYDESKQGMELKIMYSGIDDIEEMYDEIVKSLYEKVYRTKYPLS